MNMAVIHGIDMQHFSQCEVLTGTYQIDTSHQTPLINFITSLIMYVKRAPRRK